MFRADRGRKHLNDQERVAIVAFTEAGQTMALISECLDVGAANVPSWQNWFRETAR
jgi:transposase